MTFKRVLKYIGDVIVAALVLCLVVVICFWPGHLALEAGFNPLDFHHENPGLFVYHLVCFVTAFIGLCVIGLCIMIIQFLKELGRFIRKSLNE